MSKGKIMIACLVAVFLFLMITGISKAGLNEWTSHGPEGGYVRSLAINPNTPSTIYAGTWGGGVFKSTNGGGNWTAMNTGLTSTYVYALAIDPNTPLTIYAGTSGGVFKSTNGGGNWTAMNTGLTNTYVHALAIDPNTPLTIYAGTWGGVFKSTNGGGNWTAMNTGLTNTYINALAINPDTPSTIYAGTDGGGVFDYEILSPTAPPAKPTSLTAMATSSSSIALLWKDNSDNETGFKIQRKEGACDSSNSWSLIATKEANAITHTNTGLTPNTTYSYRVRAYNAVGDSAYSNCASAKTAPAGTPKAPTNLNATSISASQIKLIWTDNSTDEKNFRIYRKTGSGLWNLFSTKGDNVVIHTDTTATGNTATDAYSYYVQACNNSGCSPATNYAVVPYKPTSLKATAVSSSRINLTWTDKSNNETGFQIYRKSGTCSSTNSWSKIATTGPNITSYSNTGLTPGRTYSYKIRAYTRSSAMPYAYGYSLYSNCSEATTTSTDCVNIAGTWSGLINDVYEINLYLSQNKCAVTGTIESPDSCPAKCGMPSGPIQGYVSKNTFSLTIPNNPMVDCNTCEVICYSTDEVSLTVTTDRMHGTAQLVDCEDNTIFSVTLDLTRSDSNSAFYMLNNMLEETNIGRSSLILLSNP